MRGAVFDTELIAIHKKKKKKRFYVAILLVQGSFIIELVILCSELLQKESCPKTGVLSEISVKPRVQRIPQWIFLFHSAIKFQVGWIEKPGSQREIWNKRVHSSH